MNFSFELSWALLTGNVNPEAIRGMSTIAWAIFGWLTMVRSIVMISIAVLMIISRWKIFTKAGFPWRGIFIPFYNRYLMFKLGGRSGWNFLWILIPPVFVVLMIINYFKIARRFWKHPAYGLGIRFLKIIFIPILAFDDSKYTVKKMNTRPITKVPVKVEAKPVAKAEVKPAIKPVAKAPVKKIIKKKAPAKKIENPVKKTIKPVKKAKPIVKKK